MRDNNNHGPSHPNWHKGGRIAHNNWNRGAGWIIAAIACRPRRAAMDGVRWTTIMFWPL